MWGYIRDGGVISRDLDIIRDIVSPAISDFFSLLSVFRQVYISYQSPQSICAISKLGLLSICITSNINVLTYGCTTDILGFALGWYADDMVVIVETSQIWKQEGWLIRFR